MNGISKLKKIGLLSIIIYIVIIIAIVIVIKLKNGSQYHHFEDINGENKALAKITNEMIENTEYEYLVNGNKNSSKGEKSGVEGKYSDYDYSYVKNDIEKLSGIYISNTYLGNGYEIRYTISSNVKEGNFKIVITDDSNKILYDVPIDQTVKISFVTELGKLYFVKYVGESAKVSVEIKRNSIWENI